MKYIVALIMFFFSCDSLNRTNELVLPIKIDLGRTMSNPDLQISGLDWYGDKLVLLTQIPSDFKSNLFYIKKNEIKAFLKDTSFQIAVSKMHIDDSALQKKMGRELEYEAIVFNTNTIYLVIEGDSVVNNQFRMKSWIVRGNTNGDDTISVDAGTLKKIPLPAKIIPEMACEALTLIADSLYVLYEANGRKVNYPAYAYRMDLGLKEVTKISMTPVEYRITDATRAGRDNKFWVINNFYKGELIKLNPAKDEILPATLGSKTNQVKRLIQLQLINGKIGISNPKSIMLTADNWNWEGLAKLDNMGFLIINDTYGEGEKSTRLAFIKKELE